MKSLFEQYRDEFHDVEFCVYCYEPKGDKRGCCQENHFIPFQDFDIEEQKDIIDGEIEYAFQKKKVNE